MKASQLRDLARKYAAGNLSHEQYVAERTQLIDGMVSGVIEIRYRDVGPADAPPRRHVPRRWRYVVGSLLLVGLLLLALLAYFFDDGAASRTESVAAGPVTPQEPGTDLLRAFVSGSNWSEHSLQQLESRWDALSPFQREAARRSAWFRRVKHETAQRIREQEALVATGEMDALLLAARLRTFADRLGFEPGM